LISAYRTDLPLKHRTVEGRLRNARAALFVAVAGVVG
jgi:hypothetical protein